MVKVSHHSKTCVCGSRIDTKLVDFDDEEFREAKKVTYKFNKRPKGYIAHLSNTDHNSNQQAAAFGINDMVSSLVQTIES